MPSYSSSLKKLVVEQLLSKSKTLEQIQDEYKVSRTTIFRWLAQYRSKLNLVNDELSPSALSNFAYENSAQLEGHHGFYGHSKVENNHEIIKIYCKTEVYEHKLTYGQAKPLDDNEASSHEPNPSYDSECAHSSTLANEEAGYFREFKLSELLQAATKAQMSLWHGPKCDEIARYYGISMDKLREFYELVNQEGLVSGSLYGQMQHQLVNLQEEVANYKLKVQALEAKEELYRFYLDAFKKQSAYLKLDFNSLNDQMKQDFLGLIQKLKAQGMTTQEAADMIGINMRTYYRWLKQVESSSPSSSPNSSLSSSSGSASDNQSSVSQVSHPQSSLCEDNSSPQGQGANDNHTGSSNSAQSTSSSFEDHEANASTHDTNLSQDHEGELTSNEPRSTLAQSKLTNEDYVTEPGNLVLGNDLASNPNDPKDTKPTLSQSVASNPLKLNSDRPEYKFISKDEVALIKELVLLPEYQGLKVKDCYDKLKAEQLLTMSLSTFYRTINQDPQLKAALKGKKSTS